MHPDLSQSMKDIDAFSDIMGEPLMQVMSLNFDQNPA